MPEPLAARLCRWWLLAAPLAALAWAAGPNAERALVALGLALCLAGILAPARRRRLAHGAAGALVAAELCLAARLLGDAFAWRYVWLYSAPELPAWLKLANLWGGDEGTLLLLAALLALAGVRLTRQPGAAGPGALVLSAWLAGGALIWDPFAPTSAADLARSVSQGMNAHLVSPWMALHPPLIFGAYLLVLAPVGGALEALARGQGDWPRSHGLWLRLSWLVLSSGLVAGMWWAYEDFTFGQFWHWDPVQTSVFMVWALASAQLHLIGRYRPHGRFRIALPLAGVLTALAALVSMAITRSETLASSHRYVGDSSLPLFLALGGALAVATLVALALGLRRARAATPPPGENTVLLAIVSGAFMTLAGVAAWQLVYAYLGAWLGWPRPEHLKPFFETLARWTGPEELRALRAAFAEWDVDRYAMNRWLAAPAILLALLGGHYFLPGFGRIRRWLATIGAASLALIAALYLQPVGRLFAGTGLTSSSTVAIFPWLDALLVSAGYLLLAAAASLWAGSRSGDPIGRPFWAYRAPLALIHGGVVLALVGGGAATVLDTYAQTTVAGPDFDRPLALPDGYTVSFALSDLDLAPDGGRGGGFRSVARVGWQLERDGQVLEAAEGHSVYRDARPPARADQGPVRLMCEILDYRYARYVSDAEQMIHPFIHRGLWRDVQVWVPAFTGLPAADEGIGDRSVPVVLKVYPLMGWLWIGLALALLGAAWRCFVAGRSQRGW